MDGWVRVLRPFSSISVISRWWKGEHERLCAMKRRLGSGRISPPAGFEPATPWSEVGSANRSATWTPAYGLDSNRKTIYIYWGFFYSPKTSDEQFFEKFNKNIDNTYEIIKNVIILGDLNEDLLNQENHNLKNVLLVNSLRNIIKEPTRGNALLDPVITSFEQSILDSGIISISQYVSDHSATFLVIPFEYCWHTSYKRKVWLYKRADYTGIDNRIGQFDWSPLLTLPLNEAVEFFHSQFS